MSNNFSSTQVNIRSAIQKAIGKTKSVLAGMTKEQAQEHLEVSRKNWIINGDMQVSQRGDYTSATALSSGTFYLDRWKANLNVITANIQDTGGWQKIIATSTGSGYILIEQIAEDLSVFQGKTITISCKVKSNNANARILLRDGSSVVGSSNTHSGDGNEEILSLTVAIDSAATLMKIWTMIGTASAGNVSITSGDYIEFTNVKLEIGDTATPFESRSYAEELALCQRYYWKMNAGSAYSPFGYAGAETVNNIMIQDLTFPVEMRTIPTLGYSALTDFNIYTLGVTLITTPTAITIVHPSNNITRIRFTKPATFTDGNMYFVLANNTTNAYLDFSAEL